MPIMQIARPHVFFLVVPCCREAGMPNYYVANTPQPNGEYELHRENCQYLAGDNVLLGWFGDCREALAKAMRVHENSNGCYWCCRAAYRTPPHGHPPG